jgi:two-component system, OmpR family, sensor histidine kinase RstB
MRLLYFRVIVGVFVVLGFSFLLPRFLFRPMDRDEQGHQPNSIFRPGSHRVLEERLDAVSPADLPQEVELLGKLVDYPIRLAEPTDSGVPANIMSQRTPDTSDHRPPFLEEVNHLEYVPLRHANKVLIMGPFPQMPRRTPDNSALALLVALTLLVVGVTGFIIVAPVARNLRILENAATAFGEGALESRAKISSRDAVGSVARRFNHMAESIEKMIQRERQLLQSVSHELRTPIARIRFSLDMLGSAETGEERSERIGEIDTEIAEIDQLVGELLDYNRYHSDSLKLSPETFSVRPVLEEIDKRLQDFRPEIHLDIVSPGGTDCTLDADRLLFRRAIQNLIQNAIRFAREKVTITCYREGAAMVVTVTDDGPGIPADQRQQVLKPFYRVESADGKGHGGAGLGLAIVSRILELHGGRITVGESPGGGASFSTVWPDHEAVC